MVHHEEIEALATDAFRASGLAFPCDPVDLVRKIIGRGERSALRIVPKGSLGGPGMLLSVRGEWRAVLDAELGATDRAWCLCSSVAEYLLMGSDRRQDFESTRNRLAAALLVPRTEAQALERDEDVIALATAAHATQTCVWLRRGEVSRPTAVLTPVKILSRGLDVAELATCATITRGPITDAPSRWWFRA